MNLRFFELELPNHMARNHSIEFRWATLGVFLVALAIFSQPAHSQVPAQQASLARIDARTVVDNANAKRWNRVVLVAQPRIATGDVDSLSAPIRKAATSFALTILATVEPVVNSSGITSYKLAEVGVGHSTKINGIQTVITYETVKDQGADPGFIGRQVLKENERMFSEAKIVVQSSAVLVFDAPGIMHRKNKHRKYILRHLVYIHPNTGEGAAVVWLLGKDSNDNIRPVNEPMRLVLTGTQEDRKIHVDGNQFTLGIPSETAFGLDDLPPGAKIPWTAKMAKVCNLSSYDQAQLGELTTALGEAINAVAKPK